MTTSTHEHFFNRELSWLEFNRRVLEQARYAAVPLLERVKFLAITGSNLDEFFMVRVGGLQIQKELRLPGLDPTGKRPEEQLRDVLGRVREIVRSQYDCLQHELMPALASEGIERIHYATANLRQKEMIDRIFVDEVFPVVTPMMTQAEDPFPHLVNLGLYVGVRLIFDSDASEERYALLPLGRALPRFVTVASDKGYKFILLEDIIVACVQRYFPEARILEAISLRVTRNADISVREDSAEDLLRGMEKVLHQRRSADCVRLEIAAGASDPFIAHFRRVLDLDEEDVFSIPGPLDISGFMYLAEIEGFPALRNPAWPPQPSPWVDPVTSMFDQVADKDILLVHPYESFEPVLRMIEEAADDPDVLAIKQILYRTSRRSPIVAALQRAAERGKYVTAIVELKARFDEARNIEWARELERSGVQVIYGVKGLKTHAKICIIVRRSPNGIQRFIHFGTGNYNEATARQYSDISYFTCHDELGADASSFFNAITGMSQPQSYRLLDSAPLGLRKKIIHMIEVEAQRKRQGQKALIAAKLNACVDPEIIEALYQASQAGVTVRLNIRGICCLRPGVPGLSENISVVSVVDRYLEHARILYFYHGGEERVFISSADWMPRNLDRRIELLIPIEDLDCRKKLIDVLDTYFRDNQNAWRLMPDGNYERLQPASDQAPYRAQRVLNDRVAEAVKEAERSRFTMFQPHLASSSRDAD